MNEKERYKLWGVFLNVVYILKKKKYALVYLKIKVQGCQKWVIFHQLHILKMKNMILISNKKKLVKKLYLMNGLLNLVLIVKKII